MVANGRPVLVAFIALELSLMNYLHFYTSVSRSHAFYPLSEILSGFVSVSTHPSLSLFASLYKLLHCSSVLCLDGNTGEPSHWLVQAGRELYRVQAGSIHGKCGLIEIFQHVLVHA